MEYGYEDDGLTLEKLEHFIHESETKKQKRLLMLPLERYSVLKKEMKEAREFVIYLDAKCEDLLADIERLESEFRLSVNEDGEEIDEEARKEDISSANRNLKEKRDLQERLMEIQKSLREEINFVKAKLD